MFLCFLSLVIALQGPAAAAVGYQKGFFPANNISMYDPRIENCSEQQSSSGGKPGDVSDDELARAEYVMRYFTKEMGMTLVQASGFAGNMHAESNIDPRKIQGGAIAPTNYKPVDRTGFGLVQWTFSSRQSGLVEMAGSTRSVTEMNLQLDYVRQELMGPWKSTLLALSSTPNLTPEKAAIIVHGRTPKVAGDPRFAIAPKLGYEASNDTASGIIENRAKWAEKFYDAFKDDIPDGNGIIGTTTTLSTSGGSPCSSTAVASGTCSATAPYYGSSGGNGQQLRQAELEKLYGKGLSAAKPNIVTVDFLGKPVKIHKAVAGCLQAVVDEIKKNNIRYTVREIGGWRESAGGGSVGALDGYHSYGAAIDINPSTNPCYDLSPFKWCFKSADGTTNHDIPQSIADAFRHHGWSWGGDWDSMKDWMHFEYNGTKVP